MLFSNKPSFSSVSFESLLSLESLESTRDLLRKFSTPKGSSAEYWFYIPGVEWVGFLLYCPEYSNDFHRKKKRNNESKSFFLLVVEFKRGKIKLHSKRSKQSSIKRTNKISSYRVLENKNLSLKEL